jgi:hypothetical protein
MYIEILSNEDHYQKYYSENKLTNFDTWKWQKCTYYHTEWVAYWAIREDGSTDLLSEKYFNDNNLSITKKKKVKK